MLRWKLLLDCKEIRVYEFVYANPDCKQCYEEDYFGKKIPLDKSFYLEEGMTHDVMEAVKGVIEAFKLQGTLEISSRNKLRIFCEKPYTNYVIYIDENEEIRIGSEVGFFFTEEQFNSLMEFAKILKSNKLICRNSHN